MRAWLMIALVVVLGLSGRGYTETFQDAYDKASSPSNPSLRVVIEDLSSNAALCGIDEASITSIAALTLRNNGVRVVDQAALYLYVQATAVQEKSVSGRSLGCAVGLLIRVQRPIVASGHFEGFAPRSGRSRNVLCESGGIYTSSESAMGNYFMRELETHIKLCLGQLDY